jgi:hypothetical protein
MARLYCMGAYEHDLLGDVEVNAVEGQVLVTIKSNEGKYLSAHENKKHMYWSDDAYGWWEYFSFDIHTERIQTIHDTFVWFDGVDLWQYPKNMGELEGSVILVGNVANRSEEEYTDVYNNHKRSKRNE